MITVRQATEADIDQLSDLFNLYRIFYRKSSDMGGAKKFLTERLSNSDSCIFVAGNGGELVGFTQLYPQISSTRMRPFWLLNDLYVRQEFRGKGVSKLLIEAAKQKTRETKGLGLMLETEKSNTVGNQLYPATGFSLSDNNFYWWDNSEG